MAGESALTRFANSEIHQNVAERRGVRQPPVRERPPGRRRVVGPGRRRGHPRARRARRGDRRDTSRSSRTGRACRSADPPPTLHAGWSERTAARQPGAAGRGRPRCHRRGRRGGRHGLRLVLDRGRGHRGRQHQGHPRRRAPHDLAAADRHDGPRQRDRATPSSAPSTRPTIDAAAIGREAAERARTSANPVDVEPGDYPGRAPPVRGRRPARHARLPRLLGAGGPGGSLVLRARQAGRLAAGDDRRRRPRPGRPADRHSTPRACRSSACR